MRCFRVVVGVIILSLGVGCASGSGSPGGRSDLELTWYHALSAVPSKVGSGGVEPLLAQDRWSALQKLGKQKVPVVIYLHGCTGLGGDDKDAMAALAQAGYVVIAPDSMARAYRPRQCSSRSKSGGYNLFVFDFRQAEINFALQQLFEQDWVDWDNMFLVGVSEGALAVAHSRSPAFKARVITQWTCHGSSLVRGLSGPEDTPVLAVVRADDPWYDSENARQAGDCGSFFGDRPGSKSIVLQHGSGHGVMDEPEVMREIIAFLNRNRKR